MVFRGDVQSAIADDAQLVSLQQRMAVALVVAVLSAAMSVYFHRGLHSDVQIVSDLDQAFVAARLLWQHQDPYPLIGHSAIYQWPWPLYYPLTAAVIVMPIAWLPLPVANPVFCALSGGLLAFGITKHGFHRLPVFLSGGYLHAIWLSQWSPLLAASVLLPVIGFVLAGKPTIGAALFLARPSRVAFLGGCLVLAVSLLLQPSWPMEWLAIVRAAAQYRPPISYLGGIVVLLALLRWRRTDARLVLLLACIPQTADVFETVPLFLVCRSFREAVILAATTTAAWCVMLTGPMRTALDQTLNYGVWIVLGAYLPAVIMILRRPNDSRASGVT